MRYPMRRLLFLVPVAIAAVVIYVASSIWSRHSSGFHNYRSWTADVEFLIQPEGLHPDKSVLVCIISNPKDLKKRQAIRETWGTTHWLQVIFLLGAPQGPNAAQYQKTVRGEGKLYNDVLQMNVNEHYSNATLKSVALVQWAANAMRKFGYRIVIKGLDDIFVNTPLLFSYMDHFTNGNAYGLFHKNVKVERCSKANCSKWALRKDVYFPDVFPPYLDGIFYVLTEEALRQINEHLFEPQMITVEDVYVTGLVAGRAGVSRFNMPDGTKIESGIPSNRTVGNLKKSLLVQSNCDAELQKLFWKEVYPLLHSSV